MGRRLVMLLACVACAAASGCVTETTALGLGVRVADEQGVKGCKYLGDVHARSGLGGGPEDARVDGRNKAGQLGATHVLFVSEQSLGHDTFQTLGRAYQCGAPQP